MDRASLCLPRRPSSRHFSSSKESGGNSLSSRAASKLESFLSRNSLRSLLASSTVAPYTLPPGNSGSLCSFFLRSKTYLLYSRASAVWKTGSRSRHTSITCLK